MYKLSILTLLLFVKTSAAQFIHIPKSDSVHAQSLEKTIRVQRTWGIVLLVTGMGILTATATSVSKNSTPLWGRRKEKKSYLLPILLGLTSIAGSAALLHEAASNKKVAKEISAQIKIEELPIRNPRQIITEYPALALKISF